MLSQAGKQQKVGCRGRGQLQHYLWVQMKEINNNPGSYPYNDGNHEKGGKASRTTGNSKRAAVADTRVCRKTRASIGTKFSFSLLNPWGLN